VKQNWSSNAWTNFITRKDKSYFGVSSASISVYIFASKTTRDQRWKTSKSPWCITHWKILRKLRKDFAGMQKVWEQFLLQPVAHQTVNALEQLLKKQTERTEQV